MILEPGWLEIVQLFIRIALILLCINLVGSAFKDAMTGSPVSLMMIIGLGCGLITMISGPVVSVFPPGIEILLLVSTIIGISIITAGLLLRSESNLQGLKNGGGLWISGVLSIAIGTGYYLAAIGVSVISYYILNKISIENATS